MKKLLPRLSLLFFFLFVLQNYTFAQSLTIGDPFERYIRLLSTNENVDNVPSFNIRPIYVHEYLDISFSGQSHPWQDHPFFRQIHERESLHFKLYSPTLKTAFNSHLPVGQNDGALWQGKGLNTILSGGFTIAHGSLNASIKPQFTFSQNLDFGLSTFTPPSNISEYGDPRSYSAYIDLPQRFGNHSVYKFYPGQSWIRLQYGGVAAGISTENIWSGPANENPIIFSNNSPGFAHLFIGTYKPVKTVIGNFEGRFLGGRLYESDFFDENPINNKRFLNALILNYSPSFAPDLHLGGVRTIQKYYPKGGISLSDFFEVFQPFLKENFVSEENPRGNLGTHQLLSLFARWNFPGYGMEVYTEWSRNDHSGDYLDLLRHFEHARAYVLGLAKKFEVSGTRWLTTNIEVTQLEVPRLEEFRHTGSYYQNGEIIQGFTNFGQVMGAGIGPGSNNQMINVNYIHPKGLWGISLNRIVHHNDRLYQLYKRNFLDRDPWELNTVELRFGLHSLRFIDTKSFEIQADLYWSRILNYDYEFNNDKNNLNLQISIRYLFPGTTR